MWGKDRGKIDRSVFVYVVGGCITWEVDRGMDRCTGCHSSMDQVGVLQPKPGGQWARVWAAKCHPLPVGQPPRCCDICPEMSQVGQCLATTEETQVVWAQVTAWDRNEGLGKVTTQPVWQSASFTQYLIELFLYSIIKDQKMFQWQKIIPELTEQAQQEITGVSISVVS